VPSELTANRDINEAIEICEVAAYSEEEQRRYEKYWDRVRYENTLLHEKFREGAEEGLKEGLAEGEAKGRVEGRTEFILNAYQNGISIEQIAKIVQLSIENVTKILKQ
jgi:predicted transposase/invertase (TIGR01784 family)